MIETNPQPKGKLERTNIERITQAGQRWAAVCKAETRLALKICITCADTTTQAFQAYSAYMGLVSMRDSQTLTSSVSDSQAGELTARTRKSNKRKFNVSGDTYRKSVKPLLKAWGLIDYTQAKNTDSKQQQNTRYTFPAFSKWLSEKEKAVGKTKYNYSDGYTEKDSTTTPTGCGETMYNYPDGVRNNHIQTTPTGAGKLSTTIPSLRDIEYREIDSYIERGDSYTPAETSKWTKCSTAEACPICMSKQIEESLDDEGLRVLRCKECGIEFNGEYNF